MIFLKKLFQELLVPAGMLAALIIGAGMFSLPYVFYHAGTIAGLVYLAAFAVIFSLLHVMYAEVIEKTPGDHRLIGYVRTHLGPWGEYLSYFSTILGFVFTLLIYLVLGSHFLQAIYPLGDFTLTLIIFWIVATIPILFNVVRAADLGSFITIGKAAIIFAIFFFGVKSFDFKGAAIDYNNLFLPYSVILFAMYGRAAISSIRAYFKSGGLDLGRFKPAIVIGTVVSAILYCLFAIGVIGVSGPAVSPDGVSGLAGLPGIFLATAVLGVLSILTPYLFIGLELREILIKDLKFSWLIAYSVVIFIPATLYFLGLNNLIWLMDLAGGVFISIESMLVIIMWVKVARPRLGTRILAAALAAAFFGGALFEIFKRF